MTDRAESLRALLDEADKACDGITKYGGLYAATDPAEVESQVDYVAGDVRQSLKAIIAVLRQIIAQEDTP